MQNDRFIQLLTSKIVNELTDAEREELRTIIKNDPDLRHRKEILNKFWNSKRVSSLDNMAMFKKLMAKIENEEKVTDHIPEQQFSETAIPVISYIRYWYSAAAILVVCISIFAVYSNRSALSNHQAMTTKWFQRTTKPAVKTTIKLSDGTIVTLNSATTLKYPDTFNGDTREVYLDGEAYFDVHKDHQHPFIIHANKMNVRVLGTAFNVKSYLKEPVSETTLIRGSVQVTLNDRPSDRIILKPNEKLIVQNNTNKLPISKSPDTLVNNTKGTNYSLTSLTHFPNNDKTIVETSWVQNKLVFADKDFLELSVQLERWYGVHFTFANDKVKAERFSGIFEKETLPEALDALKIVTPFNYRMDKSTVYIY